MKKINFILVIGIVLLSKISFSQHDTNYVHLTKDRFIVTPIFEFYKTVFNLINTERPNLEDENFVEKSFSTKNNLYLGVGLSFYRLGVSISFLLPHSNVSGLEKSESFSFVGGYSLKKLYGELRLRKYSGFQEQVLTYRKDVKIINML